MEAGAHSMSPGNSHDKKRRGSEAGSEGGIDEQLPPALARLATTPEEVEWVRAQQRIARAQAERRRSTQMRGTKSGDRHSSDDDNDDSDDSAEGHESSDGSAECEDDLGPSQPSTYKKYS